MAYGSVIALSDANAMIVESTAARYKRATSQALREKGFKGKVWTRGYDKRFCFDEKSLRARVDYVKKHFSSLVFNALCEF